MISKRSSGIGLLAALATVCLGTASADPMIQISNLPTTYTPGSTISFDISLVGDGTELSLYSIPIFASSTGVTAGPPGGDFVFAATVATGPNGNIFPPPPFPLPPTFTATPATSAGDAILTVADSVPPALAVPFVGPRTLANVTLTTPVTAGDISIGFAPGASLLDGVISSPPFGSPVPFTTGLFDTGGFAHSGTITAVPEPGTVGFLAFGSLSFVAWRMRRKARGQSAIQA